MSSNTKLIQGISEQYLAGLKMLEDIIIQCNDELWQDFTQEIVVSQVVYHAIGSCDFYLAKNKSERESFEDKYGKDDETFHDPNLKLTKKQLTDYLDEVKVKAKKRFNDLTVQELNNDPLFEWHGTSVLGSILYDLRHLMLHVGALHVRVNVSGKEPLPWISKIYGDERDKKEEMNRQGVTYLQKGDLKEAEKLFMELCENSEEPIYFYNLACCYSLQGDSEKSVDTLKICLKYDKTDRFKDLAKKDTDFTKIRDLPAFKELLN